MIFKLKKHYFKFFSAIQIYFSGTSSLICHNLTSKTNGKMSFIDRKKC